MEYNFHFSSFTSVINALSDRYNYSKERALYPRAYRAVIDSDWTKHADDAITTNAFMEFSLYMQVPPAIQGWLDNQKR